MLLVCTRDCCMPQCQKKARLTRVAFNPKHPILLVGDSKGIVSALKLSPNLRRTAATSGSTGSSAATDAKQQQQQQQGGALSKLEELERQKLEHVIAVARRSQAPVLSEVAAAAAPQPHPPAAAAAARAGV